MSKKRNKKKPNPVYLRGLEEGEMKGIAKTTYRITDSIDRFSKMEGVGKKTMDKLYEAFNIRLDITDEEEKELQRKWGRFK
ncbi:MAG TPA: hypothetical protein VK094_00210 [Pseudogracilibacillus sp.]|nr:hypothetical protein [Pseudogracilibacillus sp.]